LNCPTGPIVLGRETELYHSIAALDHRFPTPLPNWCYKWRGADLVLPDASEVALDEASNSVVVFARLGESAD